jgi:enediyne biosynthesis protein E4
MANRIVPCRLPAPAILLLLLVPSPSAADGIRFENVARDPAMGLAYARVRSATDASYDRLKALPVYGMAQIVATPEKARGAPGVAIFDFDRDGDLDIYVTNGPGAANSLFANRLAQTGKLGFHDVAREAGVDATVQDSTGVCFGDLDNDGDEDLLVLGRSEANRLFVNRGDGTFADATAQSGLDGGTLAHTACSMGDVDGDGRLDVVVANTFDWSSRAAIMAEPFASSQPNQLYLNAGGNRFTDVSESSGLRHLTGFAPPADGAPTITWAIAMVDYDLDGDLDILQADDQGAIPPQEVARGLLHLLENDGHGHFSDVSVRAGLAKPGLWMGLAFGDFDCDGRLDFFATNMGDYNFSALGIPMPRGAMASRWFLGRPDGTFADPGVGDLKATGFGWSAMAPDYDLDGDLDLVFYGSLDAAINIITADNPGAVLENQGCRAAFRRDARALAGTDHTRRNVQGAAMGDLDGDGFVDLVSASAFDYPPEVPLSPYPVSYGGPFDADARFIEVFSPVGGGNFAWNGYRFVDGGLAVEINRGGNGNRAVAVRTLGGAGLVPGGAVNRDGIGAVLRFEPAGLPATLRPVVGGASYASQDSLEAIFGLGRAARGTLEVQWPAGVRNRLYDLRAGEKLIVPEIPCSFAGDWESRDAYRGCVARALGGYVRAKALTAEQKGRLLASALRAYDQEREEAATRPHGGGGERKGPARP